MYFFNKIVTFTACSMAVNINAKSIEHEHDTGNHMHADRGIEGDHSGDVHVRSYFGNSLAQGVMEFSDSHHHSGKDSDKNGGNSYELVIHLDGQAEDFDTIYEACMTEDKNEIMLNYHIHDGRPDANLVGGGVTSECAPDAGSPPVGGHYDPTLACGAATGETENCGLLNRNGSQYDCTPETYNANPWSCEVGDLSNKHGMLEFKRQMDGDYLAERRQHDAYGALVNQLEGKSIVFHCGSPRVFCATLDIVDPSSRDFQEQNSMLIDILSDPEHKPMN